MRLLSAGVLSVLVAACTGQAELVVDVRSDYAPGLEVDEVVVEVDGSMIRSLEVQASYDLVGRGVRVPSLRVAPGRHDVVVSLRRAGMATPIAIQPAAYTVSGNSVMQVWVSRACERVMCPPPGMPELTACDRRRCVAPECVSSSCAPDECVVDGDCDRTGLAECARVTCSDGRCLAQADDTACPFGVCEPELGCIDMGFLDAGAPRDAGVDAPMPDAPIFDVPGLDAPVIETPDAPATPSDTGVDAPIDAPPPPPFYLFTLAPGATAWIERPTSGAAPSTPVRAAFTNHTLGGIVALTDTDAHLLRTSDAVWVGAVPRSTAFAALEGTGLQELTEFTGVGDENTLYAFTRDARIGLTFDPASLAATLIPGQVIPYPALEDYWRLASAPPLTDIQAVFSRASDPYGWVVEDAGCGDVTGWHYTFFSRTSAAAPTLTSVLDHTHGPDVACFVFAAQMSVAEYPPLTYAADFDLGLVEAVTDYDGTLYAFTR